MASETTSLLSSQHDAHNAKQQFVPALPTIRWHDDSSASFLTPTASHLAHARILAIIAIVTGAFSFLFLSRGPSIEAALSFSLSRNYSSAPYFGIGKPVRDKYTDLFTTRYVESRLFFSLPSSCSSDPSKSLSLTNPQVSRVVFPEESLEFGKVDREERIDNYIVLDASVPGAKQIGFKVRGGEYASLELKTTVNCKRHVKEYYSTLSDTSYNCWVKSRKRGIYNLTAPGAEEILVEFLQNISRSQPAQKSQSDAAALWLRRKHSTNKSIAVIQASKIRRFAFINNATISIQEADIVFRLSSGVIGHTSHFEKDPALVTLRSWSAETLEDDKDEISNIAKRWYTAVPRAFKSVCGRRDTNPFWVASYPAIIQMLHNTSGDFDLVL